MSGFDWTGEASGEGGQNAERLLEGPGQMLTVAKVVIGKKGGEKFKSRAGDPQIMVVFKDDEEREAAIILTLSKKAGWVLARLLHRFGQDTEELKNMGVEPSHFASPNIHNQYLVGLRGRADVTYTKGDDGKLYPNIEPCSLDEVHEPSAAPTQASAIRKAVGKDEPAKQEPYTPVFDESSIPF